MALLRLLLVRRKLLKITRFQPKLLEIPSFYCPCVVTQEAVINIQGSDIRLVRKRSSLRIARSLSFGLFMGRVIQEQWTSTTHP